MFDTRAMWYSSGAFTINFENNSQIFQAILLLTLSRQMPAGFLNIILFKFDNFQVTSNERKE